MEVALRNGSISSIFLTLKNVFELSPPPLEQEPSKLALESLLHFSITVLKFR
jgi:hypothetical protein